MLLDLIALVLLVASAITLVVMGLKKFSILATIDVNVVPQEKLEQKKEDLIAARLKRKWQVAKEKTLPIIQPIIKAIGNLFNLTYQKALALEKHYQEKAQATSDQSSLNQQKILALLSEGEELYKAEDYGLAEKKFIEVISLDHRNIRAYDNLGKVYAALKDYEHAIEATQYALKLDNRDSSVHHDLSTIFKELGNFRKAIDYEKKAIKLDPNNPKYLDALIEICIMHKDKFLAKETFRKLKKVNPENQKLPELEQRINEIRF